MNVTKEDVDKAEDAAEAAAWYVKATAADAAAENSWRHYQKLKKEYEANERRV